MSILRVLRTAKATLSRTFYLDEVGTDATGAVNVTATRLDGTIVEGPTAATGPDANHAYSYAWPGRDLLDELVLTWSATVAGDAIVLDQDRLQIVGGFFFSLTEGRGVDKALASTTLYPTAKLIEKRIEVEDEAERICGQAFVPRFRRVVLDGTGRQGLPLGDPWVRTVRAISIIPTGGGTPTVWTTQQIAAAVPGDDGVLRLWSAWWIPGHRNIIVEYEYGLDYPPPELARVSKLRFKSLLLANRVPVPAGAIGDQGQLLQATVAPAPTRERTGLPEVDAVYARFPSPIPEFG
jgi:hypothetical protein